MYQQSLYKIVDDHVPINSIKRLNKAKRWEYGYNKEHDIVVISKTGKIGEIYEIQNLKIALPPINNAHKFKSDKWEVTPYPKELNRVKTIFDWKEQPIGFPKVWVTNINF